MYIDSLVTVRGDLILLNLRRLHQGLTTIDVVWRPLHVLLELVPVNRVTVKTAVEGSIVFLLILA